MTATAASAAVAGLLPNTTYHFRQVATNQSGTTYGPDMTFTTAAEAPSVQTNPATDLGSNSAILNGAIDPNGSAVTDAHYEYGTSTNYGAVAAMPNPPGATQSVVVGSLLLTGLSPATTYHYRLVASNAAGTSYGNDEVFTTAAAPAPPPCTYPAGALVRNTDNGYEYIVNAQNQLCHVTDLAVLEDCYGPNPPVTQATTAQLAGCSLGPDITYPSQCPPGPPSPCAYPAGTLVRNSDSGLEYIVDQYRRLCYITSLPVLQACYGTAPPVTQATSAQLQYCVFGPNITSTAQCPPGP